MSRKISFKEFVELSHHLRTIAEAETLDRKPSHANKEVPLHVPGGATVVVLNDPVTPFEVVIEAIVHGTHLSVAEASKRMMAAHKNGWAAVASYPSRDIAETVASKIEEHAAHNPNYDAYKPQSPHKGPWPLTCEVMDADQS
jgi:ATP-dependent Clp protease adapter protein ClpS